MALLERRLDNVIFRLVSALTVPAARQLVGHGHVRVNGRRVDRAGFLVGIGNTITLSERARGRPLPEDIPCASTQRRSSNSARGDRRPAL